MIQDIAPYKFDNTYKLQEIDDESYVLIFDKNEVCARTEKENKLKIPKYKDIKDLHNIKKEDFTYLFKIDDFKFFLYRTMNSEKKDLISALNESESLSMNSTEVFRTMEPMWMAFAGMTAKHLNSWYSSNKYCGKCGHVLGLYDKERALKCSECGNLVYPTIAPAVIVGVVNKDKILLTKYSRGNNKRYALVAGFVEVGESTEDTVKRELMEEVGLKVKNIRYFGSQPWGFANNLLVGYYADLDGDEKITLEEDELAEGTWFRYDDIPKSDSLISLTHTMIEEFKIKKGNV